MTNGTRCEGILGFLRSDLGVDDILLRLASGKCTYERHADSGVEKRRLIVIKSDDQMK